KRDRRLAGIAPGREGEIVHLRLERRLEARMAIADVMDVVAVEIHVAAAREILDPDSLGLADRVEAGGRSPLVQEDGGIAREQIPRGGLLDPGVPHPAAGGELVHSLANKFVLFRWQNH